jgi:hypothetical protein
MKPIPYLKLWKRELAKMHGQTGASQLADKIQERHQQLSSTIALPKGKTLRMRRERLLLPGLALYQILKNEYGQAEKALVETDMLFRKAFFRVKRFGIPLLNHLPDPFPLIHPMLRSYAVSEYGPGELEVLEDGPDCFAMRVYRCYLLDTLTAQGAPELTPLFCATDDWLAELLPRVRWERTHTLSRGGAYCDFCWRRKNPLKGMKP